MHLGRAFIQWLFFYSNADMGILHHFQIHFLSVSFRFFILKKMTGRIGWWVCMFLELGSLTTSFQRLYSIFHVSLSKISNPQHFYEAFQFHHEDYNGLSLVPCLIRNLYPYESIVFNPIWLSFVYSSPITFEHPTMTFPIDMWIQQEQDPSFASFPFYHR